MLDEGWASAWEAIRGFDVARLWYDLVIRRTHLRPQPEATPAEGVPQRGDHV